MFPDTTQMSYGLGWIVLDHRGHKLLAHGGALDGQRAQILLAPRSKLGIGVLSNLHQTPMNLALFDFDGPSRPTILGRHF